MNWELCHEVSKYLESGNPKTLAKVGAILKTISEKKEEKMIWELINPSDPIVFEANDLEVAALAVIVVGRGQYPAVARHDGKEIKVPLFMFSDKDENIKWFMDNFGHSPDESFEHRRVDLLTVLRSFTLGKPKDLASYRIALKYIPESEQAGFKKEWKDLRQSSMNDICGYAWQCADNFEGNGTDSIPPPLSVVG